MLPIHSFGPAGAARLGQMAAGVSMNKAAAKTVRGRGGRTVKPNRIAQELRAAGSPRQGHPGTFSYPRGRSVA